MMKINLFLFFKIIIIFQFRYFENGTIYWKNPENGEIYIAYDQNYMKMSIAGYDPYYFGSTHENFCFVSQILEK